MIKNDMMSVELRPVYAKDDNWKYIVKKIILNTKREKIVHNNVNNTGEQYCWKHFQDAFFRPIRIHSALKSLSIQSDRPIMRWCGR